MTSYRPGVRGYLAFVRFPEILAELRTGYDLDRIAAARSLLRRLRPSARLRQSEIEREHWRREALGEAEPPPAPPRPRRFRRAAPSRLVPEEWPPTIRDHREPGDPPWTAAELLDDLPRACEVCGCTDEEACTAGRGPCWWVRPGLCSACAAVVEPSRADG